MIKIKTIAKSIIIAISCRLKKIYINVESCIQYYYYY